MRKYTLLILAILLSFNLLYSQDSKLNNAFNFKGEASVWGQYNEKNSLNYTLGARYIPQANYEINLNKGKLDFEVSANIYGSYGFSTDDHDLSGKVKPYRAWARYSTEQLEIRLGLQKIDFGSSTMLRSLMWFDSVDPKDPLGYTDGVYGLLGRYYFLNNATIWAWGLYGNEDTKGTEIFDTEENRPEFGGRVQLPIEIGEVAITYHNRNSNTSNLAGYPALSTFGFLNDTIPLLKDVNENRYAFDVRIDAIVGLWAEAAYIKSNSNNLGIFQNQHFLSSGVDYTFGLGNGLYTMFEHLLTTYSKKAFDSDYISNTSALNLTYPIGMFDNVSTILYYNWETEGISTYLSWMHDFNRISMYGIAYWNSDKFASQLQTEDTNSYNGAGFQIMLVYKH